MKCVAQYLKSAQILVAINHQIIISAIKNLPFLVLEKLYLNLRHLCDYHGCPRHIGCAKLY